MSDIEPNTSENDTQKSDILDVADLSSTATDLKIVIEPKNVKKKRVLTEKQRESLAKANAARAVKQAERKKKLEEYERIVKYGKTKEVDYEKLSEMVAEKIKAKTRSPDVHESKPEPEPAHSSKEQELQSDLVEESIAEPKEVTQPIRKERRSSKRLLKTKSGGVMKRVNFKESSEPTVIQKNETVIVKRSKRSLQ